MKVTLILGALLAVVAAQKGKGKGKGKSGGSAAMQETFSCIQKCNADVMTNPPCQSAMPKAAGGATPDLVPAITCLCADVKVQGIVKCVSACGSMATMISGQFDGMCKDPKGTVDKLAGLLAKFQGGGAGKSPKGKGKGMGGMGGMAGMGGMGKSPKTGKMPKGKGYGKGSAGSAGSADRFLDIEDVE